MVISVLEKVHSGGHGEGGLESNRGDQGTAYLIHLCEKGWVPGIKLPCGGGAGKQVWEKSFLLTARLAGRRKVSRFGATVRILTVPLSGWGSLDTFVLMSFGFKISETRFFERLSKVTKVRKLVNALSLVLGAMRGESQMTSRLLISRFAHMENSSINEGDI